MCVIPVVVLFVHKPLDPRLTHLGLLQLNWMCKSKTGVFDCVQYRWWLIFASRWVRNEREMVTWCQTSFVCVNRRNWQQNSTHSGHMSTPLITERVCVSNKLHIELVCACAFVFCLFVWLRLVSNIRTKHVVLIWSIPLCGSHFFRSISFTSFLLRSGRLSVLRVCGNDFKSIDR